VIKSFRDAETERVWNRRFSRRLPQTIQPLAKRKLDMIAAAGRIEDLRVPPGNRLEAPGKDRTGQHSIRINDQWRICFRWVGDDAEDVEIVDYHA
jgi:toxin HigB-1